MRVVVVVALAAALTGCTSVRPQQPIHSAARPHTITGMKRWPRHHYRPGRSGRIEVSATRATPRSPGVDAQAAAPRVTAIVSAKLGNPAAITLQDIEAGKAAGSFCGVAQVKGASGEAREIPFVVQGDEAYVIDGSDDRKAAAAIHRMCDQ